MSETANIVKLPAFVDLHVHLREPGYAYKETIHSGTMAAAAGGYSDVFAMPNLNPAPDSVEHLMVQKEIIDASAVINVHPYCSITIGQKGAGQLVDFKKLAKHTYGFSDDGKGIQSESLMREAMKLCHAAGSMIVAHCEVDSLLKGGYIHAGKYATEHGHSGICSESEYKEVERDIRLVEATGCRLHVCHVSTKESVSLIRDAKKKGLPVSCETAPHYLLLNDSMLEESGDWKMNPPIRSAADQQALIDGIIDGTIDCIATDHAPHSTEEKSKGLKGSAFGIVGLETAFPLLYTYLVDKGIISMQKLMDLMCHNPRKLIGMPADDSSYTIYDLNDRYIIEPSKFISKGHSTPFKGWSVKGRCLKTVCNGKEIFSYAKS